MKNEGRGESRKLWLEAQKYIAGGVNSPVRAFGAVGGNPVFIKKGKGAYIYDADGRKYVDYVMSWGPLILGHAHPAVIKAVSKTGLNGTTFGAPVELETRLAEIITKAIPSMQRLRFTSSGTEAVMSAIRLARGFSQKEKIIKFTGGYHGHVDSLLVKAGSGLATFGQADSLGIPKSLAGRTIVLPYNNSKLFEETLDKYHTQIAAVIVEPIAGNMGLVLPQKGFLEKLREITKKYRIILIFDEVISGFRFTFGGAQNLFKIKPDLTTLGKIIGGGLPAGAFGGRKEIMDLLAPQGAVYQAGTLSGNPLAMAAGAAALNVLTNKNIYENLERKTECLAAGIKAIIEKRKIKARVNNFGSLLTLFFTANKVIDYETAKLSSTKDYGAFFRKMLKKGIYLPPSQFECWFVSAAHTKGDIEHTLKAVDYTFA